MIAKNKQYPKLKKCIEENAKDVLLATDDREGGQLHGIYVVYFRFLLLY